MYVFHSAVIRFQSNQPTTATGVVAIAVDYDAKDALPTNMIGMMRNVSSSMSNVYANSGALVDKRLSRLPKYLTASPSPDLDQTIQANVLVASEGIGVAAITTIGYLFIEYDVEFFTPQ